MRPQEPDQHLDRGRFACAVRTKKSEQFAGVNGQRKIGDGDFVAIRAANVLNSIMVLVSSDTARSDCPYFRNSQLSIVTAL